MHIKNKRSAQKNTSAKKGKHILRRFGALLFVGVFAFAAFGPSLLAISDRNWAPTVQAAAGDTCEYTPPGSTAPIAGVIRDDGSCGPKPGVSKPSDIAAAFSELAIFVSGIFVAVISFQSIIIGELMGNELIMGNAWQDPKTTMDFSVTLQSFWRIIRDLVNYGFIIVLLVIAFMTVVTAGGGVMGAGESFKVGQILPKFVVAVVLVNFTWFGARVVLDAANVAAHVVYGIPASMTSYLPRFTDVLTTCMPHNVSGPLKERQIHCIYKTHSLSFEARSAFPPPPPPGTHPVSNEHYVIYFYNDPITWEDVDQSTIASIFAHGIFQISQIPLAHGTARTMWDLSINAIAVFMVMVVLIIVFTAMALVLLERVVMLWLHIVLAPLAVLLWVVKSAFGASMESDQLSLSKFISYAFLPAMMGIPLVLGLMMVIVGGQSELASTVPISGIDHFLGFKQIHNFQQLLWFVIAIAVMWQAMKVAEKMDGFTKGAISGIKSGAENFGKFVAKSPMWLPWLPIKNSKGDSLAFDDIGRGISNFKQNIAQASAKRASALPGLFGSSDSMTGRQRDIIDKVDTGKLRDLLRDLESGDKKYEKTELMRSLNLTGDEADDLMKASREEVVDRMITRTGLDKDDYKTARNGDPSAPPSTGASPLPVSVNVTQSDGSTRAVNMNLEIDASMTPEKVAAQIAEAWKETGELGKGNKLNRNMLEEIMKDKKVQGMTGGVAEIMSADVYSK